LVVKRKSSVEGSKFPINIGKRACGWKTLYKELCQ
jgi:hypothetical protein